MSKTDILNEKKQQPKARTIQFLLNFSKSFIVVKNASIKTKIFKN